MSSARVLDPQRWKSPYLIARALCSNGRPRLVGAPKAAVVIICIMMYIYRMSRRYSIAEARSRLPSIVDEAESGIDVELTRRGQPVAVLMSHREFEAPSGEASAFQRRI